MAARAFALFDTAIGICAIAWGERGIVATSLPAGGEREVRARLRGRFPEAVETAPPEPIRRAIDTIVAHLAGTLDPLTDIDIDLEGVPEFHRRVYEVARAIPPGKTLTYGEVAEKLDSPGAARAVGAALGANPFPIIVPCHRILGAGGKTGGFSAPGGTTTKMRMLTIEGAEVKRAPILFDHLPLVSPPRRPRSYQPR